jgi:hypothetical protein
MSNSIQTQINELEKKINISNTKIRIAQSWGDSWSLESLNSELQDLEQKLSELKAI